MEYISAEEFLKQPKEVQEVFLDWWQPSIGDLFQWRTSIYDYENDTHLVNCCNSENIIERTIHFKGLEEGNRIPLLSEGQLRQFIEDKTESRMVEIICYEGTGYDIALEYRQLYEDLGINLLQAYWGIALEISKEKVQHEI